MQNSSSSTPPCIKPRHRAAKTRIRRRRIDLNCGCSFYQHIDCANHGFSHRGTHHCGSGREWRFYLGGAKSPLFQDNQCTTAGVHNNHNIPRPNTVQPQPEEQVGSTQSVPELPDMDTFSDGFWDDVFK
ncbi:transcriptional activator protein [Galium leaf distortion virus]|nr:transcriptional activator protein [Galium leaf distortion virus]